MEFGADDEPLRRAMAAIGTRLKGFGLTAKIAVGTAIGNVLGGAAQKLAGTFGGIFGEAAQVDVLAKKFGITTQEVTRLAYAFERQGVGFDQFAGIMEGLATTISDAATHGSDLFGVLKLNAKELIRLPLSQSLERIVDALNNVTLEEDRIAAANQFGLGALLPILKKGSAGLKELGAEAAEVGREMSPEQAGQARAVLVEYTRAWQAVKGAVLEAGLALLPSKQRIEEIGVLARGVVAVLRGAAAAVREWAADLYASLFGAGGLLRETGAGFTEAWNGIVAAVKSKDMETAFKIATAGIKAVWFGMLADMLRGFRDLMLGVVNVAGKFGPPGWLIAGAGGRAIHGATGGILNDLQQRAEESRGEIRDLVKALGPGPGGGGGGGARGFWANVFEEAAYEAKGRAGMGGLAKIPREVKGVFALPAAQQQLGYGSSAQRDITSGVKKIADKELPGIGAGIAEIVTGIAGLERALSFK